MRARQAPSLWCRGAVAGPGPLEAVGDIENVKKLAGQVMNRLEVARVPGEPPLSRGPREVALQRMDHRTVLFYSWIRRVRTYPRVCCVCNTGVHTCVSIKSVSLPHLGSVLAPASQAWEAGRPPRLPSSAPTVEKPGLGVGLRGPGRLRCLPALMSLRSRSRGGCCPRCGSLRPPSAQPVPEVTCSSWPEQRGSPCVTSSISFK